MDTVKVSAEARDINCSCCFKPKEDTRKSNVSAHHRKVKSTMEGTTVELNGSELEVEPLAQYELVDEDGRRALRPKRLDESYGRKRMENSGAIDHCYNHYIKNYGSGIVAIVAAWQSIDFIRMYISGKAFDHFSKKTIEQSLEKITPIKKSFEFVLNCLEIFIEPVTSPVHVMRSNEGRGGRSHISPLMLPKSHSSHEKKMRDKFAKLHINVGDQPEEEMVDDDGGEHGANKLVVKTPSPSDESRVIVSSPSSDPISESQQGNKLIKKLFLRVVQKLVGLHRAELSMIAQKLEHLRECPGQSKKLRDIDRSKLLMCSLMPGEATKVILVANTIHFCWKAIKRSEDAINPAANITYEVVLKAMARAETLAPVVELPILMPRGGSARYDRGYDEAS